MNLENYRELKGPIYNGESNNIIKGINPYMYRNLISKSHVEFKTNKQQDA